MTAPPPAKRLKLDEAAAATASAPTPIEGRFRSLKVEPGTHNIAICVRVHGDDPDVLVKLCGDWTADVQAIIEQIPSDIVTSITFATTHQTWPRQKRLQSKFSQQLFDGREYLMAQYTTGCTFYLCDDNGGSRTRHSFPLPKGAVKPSAPAKLQSAGPSPSRSSQPLTFPDILAHSGKSSQMMSFREYHANLQGIINLSSAEACKSSPTLYNVIGRVCAAPTPGVAGPDQDTFYAFDIESVRGTGIVSCYLYLKKSHAMLALDVGSIVYLEGLKFNKKTNNYGHWTLTGNARTMQGLIYARSGDAFQPIYNFNIAPSDETTRDQLRSARDGNLASPALSSAAASASARPVPVAAVPTPIAPKPTPAAMVAAPDKVIEARTALAPARGIVQTASAPSLSRPVPFAPAPAPAAPARPLDGTTVLIKDIYKTLRCTLVAKVISYQSMGTIKGNQRKMTLHVTDYTTNDELPRSGQRHDDDVYGMPANMSFEISVIGNRVHDQLYEVLRANNRPILRLRRMLCGKKTIYNMNGLVSEVPNLPSNQPAEIEEIIDPEGDPEATALLLRQDLYENPHHQVAATPQAIPQPRIDESEGQIRQPRQQVVVIEQTTQEGFEPKPVIDNDNIGEAPTALATLRTIKYGTRVSLACDFVRIEQEPRHARILVCLNGGCKDSRPAKDSLKCGHCSRKIVDNMFDGTAVACCEKSWPVVPIGGPGSCASCDSAMAVIWRISLVIKDESHEAGLPLLMYGPSVTELLGLDAATATYAAYQRRLTRLSEGTLSLSIVVRKEGSVKFVKTVGCRISIQ